MEIQHTGLTILNIPNHANLILAISTLYMRKKEKISGTFGGGVKFKSDTCRLPFGQD